jgi:hypothetical protein
MSIRHKNCSFCSKYLPQFKKPTHVDTIQGFILLIWKCFHKTEQIDGYIRPAFSYLNWIFNRECFYLLFCYIGTEYNSSLNLQQY